MKRKLFTVLMMVLIVSLVGSMLIFTACNNTGKDDAGKNDDTTSQATTKMLSEVIEKLQGSFTFGNQFIVDVAAQFTSENKLVDEDGVVTFGLVAKGNLDGTSTEAGVAADGETPAVESDKSDFAIELVKTTTDENGEEVKEVVIGLAYDMVENEPFFFINLFGTGYEKINGYSVAAIMQMLNKDANADGGFNISSITGILGTIAPVLFGETGTVENNVYTFNISLRNILTQLGTFLPALENIVNVDEIIESMLGVVGIDSYARLAELINTNIKAGGTIAIAFDENNKFKSVDADINFAMPTHDEATHVFTLDVTKAVIGAGAAVDTFAGTGITDEVKAAKAKNLLNFSIAGVANGFNDPNGHYTTAYDIVVEADINPFPLLNLLNLSFKSEADIAKNKQAVLDIFGDLGYFRLTVDEVTPGAPTNSTDYPGNVLTLFFDMSAEQAIYVNLDAGDITNGLAVSMVLKNPLYNNLASRLTVSQLYDMIAPMLLPDGATTAAEGEDGGLDIMGLLGDIIALVDVDIMNMEKNGVTVDMLGLTKMLAELVAPGDDTTAAALEAILNTGKANMIVNLNNRDEAFQAAYLNFKLDTPVFGECNKDFAATDVVNGGLVTFEGVTTKYFNEITKVDRLDNSDITLLQNFNGSNIGDYLPAADDGKFYEIEGTSIDGTTEQKGYAKVMGFKGDLSVPGKTTITLIMGISSDIYGLLDFMGMDLPLFGALEYDIEVEVEAFNPDYTVTLDNVLEPTTDINGEKVNLINVGESIYDNVLANADNALSLVINGKKYAVTVNDISKIVNTVTGVDVTQQFASGVITEKGLYNVTYEYCGYSASIKVLVEDLKPTYIWNKTIEDKYLFGSKYKTVQYAMAGSYAGQDVSIERTAEYVKENVTVIDTFGIYGEKGADITATVWNTTIYPKFVKGTQVGVYTLKYQIAEGVTIEDYVYVGTYSFEYNGNVEQDGSIVLSTTQGISKDGLKVYFNTKKIADGALVDDKIDASELIKSINITVKDENNSLKDNLLDPKAFTLKDGVYYLNLSELVYQEVSGLNVDVNMYVTGVTSINIKSDLKFNVVRSDLFSEIAVDKLVVGLPVNISFKYNDVKYSAKWNVNQNKWVIVDASGNIADEFTIVIKEAGEDGAALTGTVDNYVNFKFGADTSMKYDISISGYDHTYTATNVSVSLPNVREGAQPARYFDLNNIFRGLTYIKFPPIDGKAVSATSLNIDEDGKVYILDSKSNKHYVEYKFYNKTAGKNINIVKEGTKWVVDKSSYAKGDECEFTITLKVSENYSINLTSTISWDGK